MSKDKPTSRFYASPDRSKTLKPLEGKGKVGDQFHHWRGAATAQAGFHSQTTERWIGVRPLRVRSRVGITNWVGREKGEAGGGRGNHSEPGDVKPNVTGTYKAGREHGSRGKTKPIILVCFRMLLPGGKERRVGKGEKQPDSRGASQPR